MDTDAEFAQLLGNHHLSTLVGLALTALLEDDVTELAGETTGQYLIQMDELELRTTLMAAVRTLTGSMLTHQPDAAAQHAHEVAAALRGI